MGEEIEQQWLTLEILLTALATPSSTMEDTATQKEQWFTNGRHGEYLQTPREDTYSTAGTDGNGRLHKQTRVAPSPWAKC